MKQIKISKFRIIGTSRKNKSKEDKKSTIQRMTMNQIRYGTTEH
jgi:hypothetical protein